MNLVRRPLFKDAHIFFRLRRGQLSNTRAIQHSRGEIICKRSMSSTETWALQELEADGSEFSDLSVLSSVSH